MMEKTIIYQKANKKCLWQIYIPLIQRPMLVELPLLNNTLQLRVQELLLFTSPSKLLIV